MKISISNLSEGIHAFHFSEEPAHLGLGDKFTDDITVDVTVDKTNREVLLKTEARVSGTFICDRCATEYDSQVAAAYQTVYLFDEREKARYPDGEVQVLAPGTPFIDITDDVRQYILLAVPLKLLCKPACSGLCPTCGANRNYEMCSCFAEEIDPRWEVLKKNFRN